MIEFTDGEIPEKRIKFLTAYISDIALLTEGKRFLISVMAELIKKLTYKYHSQLDSMINDTICSKETREYIETKIREEIDKRIKQQIDELWSGE